MRLLAISIFFTCKQFGLSSIQALVPAEQHVYMYLILTINYFVSIIFYEKSRAIFCKYKISPF